MLFLLLHLRFKQMRDVHRLSCYLRYLASPEVNDRLPSDSGWNSQPLSAITNVLQTSLPPHPHEVTAHLLGLFLNLNGRNRTLP